MPETDIAFTWVVDNKSCLAATVSKLLFGTYRHNNKTRFYQLPSATKYSWAKSKTEGSKDRRRGKEISEP